MKSVVGLCALCVVAGAARAQVAFYNLGEWVTPSGASSTGVVAGTDADQYFRWTAAGGLVTIGGAAPGNGVGGQARISDDGRFISGTVRDPANNNVATMARYDSTASAWSLLGGIGGVIDGETSSGWGVSGDGRSVVGLGWLNNGQAEAVRWNQSTGATVSLGSTTPGRSSRAGGVNADGSVVVGWQDTDQSSRQAAVWTNGVQQLLTTSTSDPLGEALDVTSDGNWVVGFGGFATEGQAWRWSAATGGQSLGSIFDPFWSGSATGVADDGTIVGYYRPFGPAVFGEGFIWTPSGGMINLTEWALSRGVQLPPDTVLSLPLDISADGRTITGMGRSGFNVIGWVVTIPGPGPLATLAAAGVLATCRRRRHR
jgi:uncharacterized membrane protein